MIKRVFQEALSVVGAALFLGCVGLLLTRPTNFVAYLPEIVEVVEQQFEDPVVRIVLDPGHGGLDGGANRGRLLEKELNLEVAQKVKLLLEAENLENIEVLLTRESNAELPSKSQRVAFANRFPKCYFVSIHFNGSEYQRASGTEVFYAEPKSDIALNQIRRRLGFAKDEILKDVRSERLAQLIQKALIKELGTKDRGTKNHRPFMVTRETIGPAALAEVAFISNPTEAARVGQEGFRSRAAAAIAVGILTYVKETEQDPFAGITKIVQEEPEPVASTLAE
jgi:N-acetylmuramoyl-L-alanine amidase